MSNQLQITGGAKVRNLQGVITGTSGVLSSVPLGAANGVATLDSSGKVPVSQLPSSVVTYLGTWDASTNTPTLTNGTGDAGDMYICNVAGTVNFGAGPITFSVGDWVLYGSGTWQKSNGQNGTVTSVGLSNSGNAISITNSPVTTAGVINIGFAGNSTQYINGAGNLTTFPSIITEAQKLITEVYNETGATLSKGTVVYINGGHGNLPTVTKALANSDATSAQTYGVVQADITNNNNGYVVVIGTLGDLDTQEYANGTQLYLSGTTAGAWTSTKPYAPIHLVYVAVVTRSHPTQGVVEVKIQNGYEMDELHNVSAQSPANNDGLFYTTSTSLWETKSIATALGYTPANDSLVVHLAGTETITGAKTFTDNTLFSASPLFDQSANYKVGASLVGTGNYIAMAFDKSGTGSGSTLSMKLADGTTAKAINLDFVGSPATYTYTFPSINGTIALLEGTQTFTGDKTFNGGVDFNNSLNINNTFNLRNNLVGSTLYTNFSILKSGSSETLSLLFSTAYSSKLVFNDAANYTYTFPTTSGTLALTSSLSSYVPYSGATGDVSLGSAYSLSGLKVGLYNGSAYTYLLGNADGMSINFGSYVNRFYFNNANNTYTFPNATGIVALTSNLSSYLPLTGGTLTGALNGTSATFSSSVTANGTITVNEDGAGTKVLTLRSNWAGVDPAINVTTNNSLLLMTNNTERMRITSAGNVYIGTTSGDSYSGYSILQVGGNVSTTGGIIQTWDQTVKTAIVSNGSGYGIVGTRTNHDLRIFTNDTVKMLITSGGDIAIGATSNRGYRLEVDGGNKYTMEIRQTGGDNTYIPLTITHEYTSGTRQMITFQSGGYGVSGSITSGNTTTSYNTSSDYRLKEDFKEIKGLEKVSAIKVYDFKWKADESRMDGVIAHELQEILPYAVVGEKDGKNMQGVDYSKIVPVLIKAIQEQQAQIEELKQLINK